MALLDLFYLLKRYRSKRRSENLSQGELLKQELLLIGLALGLIVGTFGLIMWVFGKK